MNDLKDKATEILASALGLDTDSIGPDIGLGITPQWDSLAHMRIVLALERILGRQLPAQDIMSIASVNDVAVLLKTA